MPDHATILMTPDDWRTLFSGAALLVSGFALYFTRVNWLQTNRPIITAFVADLHIGNLAAVFNLIVSNTGSRPAVRVRLHVEPSELLKLFDPEAPETRIADIRGIFEHRSEIPILRNGEDLTTSFGSYTDNAGHVKWLQYGAEIQIKVTYFDLEKRKYTSRQPLKIYAREGFGGSIWQSAPGNSSLTTRGQV